MLDIYSKGNYPSCALSNFASHPFVLDGIEIHSMEGFLQSLKYKNLGEQKKVCMLLGKHAKEAGKKKILWRITPNVYWKGRKYIFYQMSCNCWSTGLIMRCFCSQKNFDRLY